MTIVYGGTKSLNESMIAWLFLFWMNSTVVPINIMATSTIPKYKLLGSDGKTPYAIKHKTAPNHKRMQKKLAIPCR